MYWVQKVCVIQLKMTRLNLKIACMDAASRNDIFKFCNHIVVAHKTSTYGANLHCGISCKKETMNLSKKNIKGISFQQTKNPSVKTWGGHWRKL